MEDNPWYIDLMAGILGYFLVFVLGGFIMDLYREQTVENADLPVEVVGQKEE